MPLSSGKRSCWVAVLPFRVRKGMEKAWTGQDWAGREEEWAEAGDGTSGRGHLWNLCPALGRGAQHGAALLTACKRAGREWSSPAAGGMSPSLKEALAAAKAPIGSINCHLALLLIWEPGSPRLGCPPNI